MNRALHRLAGESTDLRRLVDPFGIAESLEEVRQAWLAHPAELAGALTEAALGFAKLNLQVLSLAAWTGGAGTHQAVAEDERFADPLWSTLPAYALIRDNYLHFTHWLEDAIYRTPGVSARQRRRAAFWARQWLNAIAPTNFLATNPVALRKTAESGGLSLLQGSRNFLDDLRAGDVQMTDPSAFRVGVNLAITPGAVVFRNALVEVLHYRATTERVREIPVVIVAPWINKYYVLDLRPENSLIRHLVEQGFDVYVTSWKNPGREQADTTFDDYMINGVLRAIDVARGISGAPQVHAVGYCLGGTALAALMAWLHRRHEDSPGEHPVAHWTLFASLLDFSRPGAIEVFIDEKSVEFLERLMAHQGYLEGRQMAWSFRMLRPNSLIWRYVVHGYLYGEKPRPLDVLYWNTDTTRLPQAMHSFYLREFYLANKLAQRDALELAGLPIDLRRIRQPLYCVGCEEDHIVPWKAAFEACRLVSGPVRFTLTSSGHILGIVNPPVEPPKRHYWAGEAAGATRAEEWRQRQERLPGTWWQDWLPWLAEHCGALKAPPPLATEQYPALGEAPGTYVLEP